MGNMLDSILVKHLVGSKSYENGYEYETINSDGNSLAFECGRSETGFMIQLKYDNGVGLDVIFQLEGSADGIEYVPLPDTDLQVTDSDGVQLWDRVLTNLNYVRVSWAFVSGTVDIQVTAFGKRRH